jgi:hypothetical protein
MARKLDDIFNECYERIRFGENLESVLRSYPQYRSQLEPLLRTTFDIGRRASFIQSRPEFRHWARVRFESAMQYPRQQPPVQARRVEAPMSSTWLRHGWAVIVSIGIVIMLGAGSTMAASSEALPTEPLYPVKQFTEEVQRVMAVSPERKAEFETDIANIRAVELQAMANAGNAAEAAKAAVRYDDQFERAVQTIIAAEGTETPSEVYVPPTTTGPIVTPPLETPPAPVTPPEVPSPAVTVSDNATPPAVVVPSDNTTPPDTSLVPPETEQEPPTVIDQQPPTTDKQPGVTEEQPSTTEGISTIEAQPSVTEEQPATATSAGSTKSSRAKELRDKLNRQKSTVDQALKDAKNKAENKDKPDWQDIRDKINTKRAAVTNTSNNQTTAQSDNKTTPSTDSGNTRSRHR